MNLPNKITLARIGAVPALMLLLQWPSQWSCLVAAVVFIAAAATDSLDGRIARSRNLVSNLGKFLDPLADKLLTLSVLVMLASLVDEHGQNWVPAWAVVVIMARELAVTGLRAMAMEQGMVLAADVFGKIKTVLQCVAIVPLVVHYPVFGLDPRPWGEALLYLALAMTVFSGVNYCYSMRALWSRDV
ncbi:MAG: CDP-diacylglycerol--glycerol-3-phosphate 3-phosphatidyltransferase [Desulfovibrio sp.]|nr:CDP-diacylglycerol--glycerol-3-phosphate 3-phosphatidyltransferase [Desulfovibrio sp.]MCA1987496.1 CDP-diacylglycerol--glycerol-3-phosphate 3-phosphatidyltransferase [Desulfovibrio sp.]